MAKFYTAVVTIFNKDGSLDYNGNKSVYENLIRNHSDGIVLMGSTGEFFNLTLTQAKDLAAFALKTVNHQMDVIVGASRMIPSESVELGNFALSQGADAVIVIVRIILNSPMLILKIIMIKLYQIFMALFTYITFLDAQDMI